MDAQSDNHSSSSGPSVEELVELSTSLAMDSSIHQKLLLLPSDGVEVDSQLSIVHLIKAYGEAIEMEMNDLAEEILKRLEEKGSPTGNSTLERVAYYLTQALEKQVDFLREEARTNYEIAFNAFYQIFPYGRFAHFTANSVILQAVPDDADIVHIVDFDIDKGVQWPPLMEALAIQGKRVMRFTSIKCEEEEDFASFEEIKLLLSQQARTFGLKLKVEERDLDLLATEMKKPKDIREENVFLAFNCMVGLPHMGKRKIRPSQIIEFLKLAKYAITQGGSSQGTITFGDGIGWGKGLTSCNGYGSIFERQVVQIMAMLASINTHFANHLKEARIAIECLFLVPYISCLIDKQMWDEISKESRALSMIGLKAWTMNKDNIMETKELVREGESFYWVCVEGLMHNQMVLGYMGTPLVKVSSWR